MFYESSEWSAFDELEKFSKQRKQCKFRRNVKGWRVKSSHIVIFVWWMLPVNDERGSLEKKRWFEIQNKISLLACNRTYEDWMPSSLQGIEEDCCVTSIDSGYQIDVVHVFLRSLRDSFFFFLSCFPNDWQFDVGSRFVRWEKQQWCCYRETSLLFQRKCMRTHEKHRIECINNSFLQNRNERQEATEFMVREWSFLRSCHLFASRMKEREREDSRGDGNGPTVSYSSYKNIVEEVDGRKVWLMHAIHDWMERHKTLMFVLVSFPPRIFAQPFQVLWIHVLHLRRENKFEGKDIKEGGDSWCPSRGVLISHVILMDRHESARRDSPLYFLFCSSTSSSLPK
jgi:hypothetical protein